MASKLPYYKRYPRDYLSDENVAMMTLEEEGAYNRLLDYCWIEGSLPKDLTRLARLCRTTPEKMEEIWPAISPCFDVDGDRVVHPELDQKRKMALKRRQKMSEGGKRGRRKQLTDKDPGGSPGPPPGHPRALATPGHSQRQRQKVDTETEEEGTPPSGSKDPSVVVPPSNGPKSTVSTTDGDGSEPPHRWMHRIFEDELGIDGYPLKLTAKRQEKYRAMHEEQLTRTKNPQVAWRAVLRVLQSSDHHMSERAYQMPESFLRNEQRRDRWFQKTVEAVRGNGTGPEAKLERRKRRVLEAIRKVP